jgi:hypothetical protein
MSCGVLWFWSWNTIIPDCASTCLKSPRINPGNFTTLIAQSCTKLVDPDFLHGEPIAGRILCSNGLPLPSHANTAIPAFSPSTATILGKLGHASYFYSPSNMNYPPPY